MQSMPMVSSYKSKIISIVIMLWKIGLGQAHFEDCAAEDKAAEDKAAED